MYKLAIFDFDGTLVNSTPGIIETMKQVCDFYRFDDQFVSKWSQLIGISLKDQAKILLPDESLDFHEEVTNKYREYYNEKFIDLCPPFEHLTEMLYELNKKEIKITIASSKKSFLIEHVLAHHDLENFFQMVIGHDRVSNHKPHPESVAITMDELGHGQKETVVIGDSVYDLEMANNAGVDAIGVTTGIHDKNHLLSQNPISIVDSLKDVLEVILSGPEGAACLKTDRNFQ